MTSPTNKVTPNAITITKPEEISKDKKSSSWNSRDVLQLDTDSLFPSNLPTFLEVKKPSNIDEELALLKVSMPAALHTVIFSFLDPTPEIMDFVKKGKEVPDYLKKVAETVTRLDINDTKLSFKQVDTLLGCFKNIKSLILPKHFDTKLYFSPMFSGMPELDFSNFSEFICTISTLRNLEELDMSSWISPEMVDKFPGMYEIMASAGKIKRLNLSDNNLTSDHFSIIFSSFKDLEYLNLNCCAIYDHSIEGLKNLTSLKSLEIENNSTITHEGIHTLSEIPTLEHLNVRGCYRYTDDWLESIAQCSNLKSLNISYGNITENSLTIISSLTNLTRLDMGSCIGMSDVIIKNITFFPKLQYLDVSDSVISDEALPYIGKLSGLEHLDVSGTYVRRDGLQNLYQLKKLKTLTAYYIPMTRFDINKIVKEIPDITVKSGKDPEGRQFKSKPIDTSSLPGFMADLFSRFFNNL